MFRRETTRNAAQDAPTRPEYERIYAAAHNRGDRDRQTENKFITVGSGREGLRVGALIHFKPWWLDRERKIINIPPHVDCECAYCWRRARDYAEGRDGVEPEDVIDDLWQPKTEASVRAVYYGYSQRAVNVIETFADEIGELDYSASTISRRIDRLVEDAGITHNVYPHAMRAAAALYWADEGVDIHFLKAMMGWETMDVAVHYIQKSGRQLAAHIEQQWQQPGQVKPLFEPEELEEYRAMREAAEENHDSDDTDEAQRSLIEMADEIVDNNSADAD
jgi:integrase